MSVQPPGPQPLPPPIPAPDPNEFKIQEHNKVALGGVIAAVACIALGFFGFLVLPILGAGGYVNISSTVLFAVPPCGFVLTLVGFVAWCGIHSKAKQAFEKAHPQPPLPPP